MFEIDIDLTRMHALGMFIEFRPSRTASDGFDFRYLGEQLFGNRSNAVAFGQRNAWIERQADSERSFIEGWEKGTRQCCCSKTRDEYSDNRSTNHPRRMIKGP